MYLYNKNILEYAEIVVTYGNSRILDIEGHSNVHKIWGDKIFALGPSNFIKSLQVKVST